MNFLRIQEIQISNLNASITDNLTVGNNLLAASSVRAGIASAFYWNGRGALTSPATNQVAVCDTSLVTWSGVLLTGGFRANYRGITGNYTVTSTDYTINCLTGPSSSFQVTLPTSVGATGQVYIIKNSGTASVTVGTTASQLIDGATFSTLSTQYSKIILQSTGSNWITIN